MKKNIPIIYSPHKIGLKNNSLDFLFLPVSLSSVVKTNPDTDVFFLNINDNYPVGILGIIDVDVRKEFSSSATDISKRYKHLSTNKPDFELFCIQRFFVVRDFMRDRNITRAFLIETDVLLFADLNDFFSNVHGFDYNDTYLSESKCISLGYVTLDYMNYFCEFVTNCYSDTSILNSMSMFFEKYTSDGKKGGICDMTFCDYINRAIYGADVKFKAKNFSDIFSSSNGDIMFDSFIGRNSILNRDIIIDMDKSLIDGKTIKKIKYVNGKPFVSTTEGDLALGSLHFQGSAKGLMSDFYVNTSW